MSHNNPGLIQYAGRGNDRHNMRGRENINNTLSLSRFVQPEKGGVCVCVCVRERERRREGESERERKREEKGGNGREVAWLEGN